MMKARYILSTFAILVVMIFAVSGFARGGSKRDNISVPESEIDDNDSTFNISANGKNYAIEVREGEPVTLSLYIKDKQLDENIFGQLVVVDLSDTLEYYDVDKHSFGDHSTTYPISTLNNLTVSLGSNLPVGTYTYYFGVDLVESESLNANAQHGDSVIVYVVDSFAAPIDPDKVITAANEDGVYVQFPINEVVIFTKDGVSTDTIKGMIESAGGTMVGQIPDYGLYQARFQTTTKEALDKIINQLSVNPSISLASYNTIAEHTALPKYPPKADINSLQGDQIGCPFSDIDYIPALAIVENLKSDISFSSVSVAVIETGVDRKNSEFSHLKTLVNLGNMGAPHSKDDHGTLVLGIIAAANDGRGVNGLASRILGDKLQLSLGLQLSQGSGYVGHFHFFSAVRRAKTHLKASIINVSAVFKLTKDQKNLANKILLMKLNDILFVAAAPNSPGDIAKMNVWPGTVSYSNVITVGGTAICKPTSRWVSKEEGSAYGQGIDIAAPAESVPVIKTDEFSSNGTADGNSLSTPMVTSLAAIIKSIDPSLKPQSIKALVVGYGLDIDASEKLGEKRLSFPNPIIAAVVNKYPKFQQLIATVPAFSFRHAILNTMYGEEFISILDLGSEHHSGYDLCPNPTNPYTKLKLLIGFGICPNPKSNSILGGNFQTENDFKLNTSLKGLSIFGKFTNTRGSSTLCSDEAGTVKFSGCKIVMRPTFAPNDLYAELYWILAKGKITATNLICRQPDSKTGIKTFQSELDAHFDKIIGIKVKKYSQYLEENCNGGIRDYFLRNK